MARRSYYEEAKRGDLLSLCNTWLLDNFSTFDKKTKLRVSLEIAKRGVKQQHELSGEVTLKLAERLEEARSRRFDVTKMEPS